MNKKSSLSVLVWLLITFIALSGPALAAQKPGVKIISPKKNAIESGSSVQVSGSASSKAGIASVWWRVNNGSWQQANGTTQWSATVPLVPGANTVQVYSKDQTGNVSKTASVSVVSSYNLVSTYWPMYDGDTKNFNGVTALGPATMTFSETGTNMFDMTITPVDTDGDSAVMSFHLNGNGNLLLDSEDAIGISLYFNPSLTELTPMLLAKGGQLKSSCLTTVYGSSVSITQTMSVKKSGTVTVPAGTFANCVTVSQSDKASVNGRSVTVGSQSYILAPNVGVIELAVISTNGTSFKLMGWEKLVSGTVNGVQIGSASNQLASSQSEVKSAGVIGTNSDTLPRLQVETPLARLDFTRLDDGQSQVTIKAMSGVAYDLEVGVPDPNGVLVWKTLWQGRLTGNSLCLSVPDPVAGTVYRLR
jgi:hypothetical protein